MSFTQCGVESSLIEYKILASIKKDSLTHQNTANKVRLLDCLFASNVKGRVEKVAQPLQVHFRTG